VALPLAEKGHLEQFPPQRLSDRCLIGQETPLERTAATALRRFQTLLLEPPQFSAFRSQRQAIRR
jgi:hypothetical protein